MNPAEKLKLLAKDLTKDFPRSPRETLAGYVVAARAVDKCRAVLAETAGEYHSGCPLDKFWLDFAGIPYETFKAFVATGATDAEIAEWVVKTAKPLTKTEIIRWNNELRYKRICDMDDGMQEYFEEYIPKFVPRNRPVYVWFDIYDIEEQRL
jgi:hypothetical protein